MHSGGYKETVMLYNSPPAMVAVLMPQEGSRRHIKLYKEFARSISTVPTGRAEVSISFPPRRPAVRRLIASFPASGPAAPVLAHVYRG